MNETVITTRGLRKSYETGEAVRGVDLDVRSGEVFAFLGPNGAGKTTTVEILEGYRDASAGEECLELYAGYYPPPRPMDEVLALAGIEGQAG